MTKGDGMFEMTYGELFLFLWAVTATVAALQARMESAERGRLLFGAAMFVKRLASDDQMRDELRTALREKPDADIKFGG